MITWWLEGIEQCVVGYRDLGRTDLTVDIARDRLARFTADALSRATLGS